MNEKSVKTAFDNFNILEQYDNQLKPDKFKPIKENLIARSINLSPFQQFDSKQVKSSQSDLEAHKIMESPTEIEQGQESIDIPELVLPNKDHGNSSEQIDQFFDNDEDKLTLEDLHTDLQAEEEEEKLTLDDLDTDLQAEEEEEKLTLDDLDTVLLPDNEDDISIPNTDNSDINNHTVSSPHDSIEDLLDDELESEEDVDSKSEEQQDIGDVKLDKDLDDNIDQFLDEDLDFENESKSDDKSELVTEKQQHHENKKNTIVDQWQTEDQDRLKEVLLYMDQLFSHLPEPVIKEFARSEYYDKYNNVFDKLGI